MNQPRNTEHTINDESQWRKTMKKLDSKLQKQRRAWPKILNTTRKYNKDENSAYRYRFHISIAASGEREHFYFRRKWKEYLRGGF